MVGKEETTPADRVDAFIAPETELRGKVTSRGTLRIDGLVDGEISTDGDVVVGESGCVSAQIRARNIVVAGKVRGNLMPAGRVEIHSTASLEGGIQMKPPEQNSDTMAECPGESRTCYLSGDNSGQSAAGST